MPMFRKKPVVIEARQFLADESVFSLINWINEGQRAIGKRPVDGYADKIVIPVSWGVRVAIPGDWIIRGVAGEHYPCKPDIFEATYEAAEPQSKDEK